MKNAVHISQDWLHAVQSGEYLHPQELPLAGQRMDLALKSSSDYDKKCFWLNIYNAGFQYLHHGTPMPRSAIFTHKFIGVGAGIFSLDDIEHGMLRRNRYKYGLGYLPQISPRRINRHYGVDKFDKRIHFGLHCGGQSCPPIRHYDPAGLEAQLEIATRHYLHVSTTVNHKKKELAVSRLFLWYHGDFGGAEGIRKIHREYLGHDFKGYRIRFKPYDWSEQADPFSG